MSELLERQLAELRAEMREALARLEGPPRTMKYARAAAMLDISVSKLKAMISSGEIFPVEIGGKRMIPLSEIERLATPRPTNGVPKSPRKKKPAPAMGPASVAAELAKLDEVAKTRRRARR